MLREVAEYPNSFSPLGENEERLETGRYTLCIGAGSTWNTVQRQRFALDEIDEVLAEVRAALQERGRTQTQWEVGSSAPDGLVDALLERGLHAGRRSGRRGASCRNAFASASISVMRSGSTARSSAPARPHRASTGSCSTAARRSRGARGRGAYRALIRARWDDAVALGTPALSTQGGSMSRPILEKLGFERVGEVHMLLDRFE